MNEHRARLLECIREIHPDTKGADSHPMLLRRMLGYLKSPKCARRQCEQPAKRHNGKPNKYCSQQCANIDRRIGRLAIAASLALMLMMGCRTTPEAKLPIEPPKTTARPMPRLKAVVQMPPDESGPIRMPIEYPVPRETLCGLTFEVLCFDGTNWNHTMDWELSADGEDLIVRPDNPLGLYKIKAWPKDQVEY